MLFFDVRVIIYFMTDGQKLRAVLFDLDGTLIDSSQIWREVDEEFFARRNMPVPEGYQQNIAHLGFRECAAFTVRNYLPKEEESAIIAEWHEMSLSKYRAKDGSRYFKPGAVSFVQKLKNAGYFLCVATASSPDFFLPVLRSGGIEGLFDAFATVEDAGKNKSFPDIFLLAAERLGVQPEECAVFEDNLAALRAAKSAGMFTAAVFDGQEISVEEALKRESALFVRSFESFDDSKFF